MGISWVEIGWKENPGGKEHGNGKRLGDGIKEGQLDPESRLSKPRHLQELPITTIAIYGRKNVDLRTGIQEMGVGTSDCG